MSVGIAGSNLLLKAFGLISRFQVTYYKYAGKTVTAARTEVDMFEPGVIIGSGTIQPINSTRKAVLGINASTNAWTWWVNYNVRDVQRDRMPDKAVNHMGAVCDVLSVTPWASLDGWCEVVLVETGEPVAAINIRPEVQP